MIRFLAIFIAKRKYVWKQEIEAATHELSARAANHHAVEKRKTVAQLTADAQSIEDNIAREEETAEYEALTGQEKYEVDREKNEAKKIADSNRQIAKQTEDEIKGHEDTVKDALERIKESMTRELNPR